jgi:large subunit ribosomal protein L5e
MDSLEEDDEEKYKRQFAKYLEDDITSDTLEDVYREAHEKIRADPTFTPTGKQASYADTKKYKQKKLSKEERQERVHQKLREIQAERS